MNTNPQKLTDAANANLDSALTMAGTALNCVERLAALNLNTARNLLAAAADNNKALLSIKSLDELSAFQTEAARPAAEAAVTYSRAAYAICTETVEEMSKIAGSQYDVLKAKTAAAIDEVLKSAPAGSEPAVAALRSTMAATDSAYNAITKAAKQVGEMAESNMTVATDSAVKALTNVTAMSKGKKKAA